MKWRYLRVALVQAGWKSALGSAEDIGITRSGYGFAFVRPRARLPGLAGRFLDCSQTFLEAGQEPSFRALISEDQMGRGHGLDGGVWPRAGKAVKVARGIEQEPVAGHSGTPRVETERPIECGKSFGPLIAR